MVKTIVIEQFSEEALRKLYLGWLNKEDWDEECNGCKMPALLHVDSDGKQSIEACPGRKKETTELAQNKADAETWNLWKKFRAKMRSVIKWHDQEIEKTKQTSDLLAGIKSITDVITTVITTGNNVGTSKLIKPTKVPSWGTGMEYKAYKKSIEVWDQNNKDMPQPARYQEVIESIKQNKDIEDLARYAGEHIVGTLDTAERQNIKEILKLLDIKFGRTRLEELESLMEQWISFNFNEHESEEEYLFAQEKIITKQNETKVTLAEWNIIWMMHGAKQRKGIEPYQLQQLRSVLKSESNEKHKDFVSKYRELKIESNRGKQNSPVKTLMMRQRSSSRHDSRTGRDSKGREFYQERNGRSDSRGQKYHRRYYRGSKERLRSFSRDMRSLSRGRRNSSRGTSRNRSKKYGCIACKCIDCEKIRKISEDLNINYCGN